MRILLLGGTSFIGRTIAERALREGDAVTLFGRGRTGAGLFPDVPRLIGDRDTDDYGALAAGEWDAVVDLSGYLPRHVDRAMDALGDRVGRYLFVSSHAVYVQEGLSAGNDEDSPLRDALRGEVAVLDNDTYGPSKVACEEDVVARFGSRATIVRPCRVAGPYDNQNPVTYWVRRGARGGWVALPGDPDQPVQIVDARDLAALVLRLVRDDRGGAFNAVGPADPTTLGALIRACARLGGTDIEIVPVPGPPPPLFPLVRPRSQWMGQRRGGARARAAGMPATPLETTLADIAAWDRSTGLPPLGRGYTAAEEAAVLARRAPGA
ncbi:MAG TPA: NAD-dependent epimerase/dehydratase family protein [Stackebrandtia sp.]|uniref:NAD-dependent epimerase/dehydratase family protein n=1 Tax=Stackebrandtia sp. TaxID=2023065 RepID=UPI002D74E56F|nr:NAD-dependent epimerase/dehydratase family protein [Stackebrandtia sp.]HZE40471.1 NAD-dependent epimerase/dehydratase family protein [Stackebrandtia sp.]